MAWTAPMTAVTGNPLTAAQFNTNVRDNLLETMPAKVTSAGDYIVATGANSLARRSVQYDFIHTTAFESRSSSSYGDLTAVVGGGTPTVGPSVTVTMNSSCMIWYSTNLYLSSGDYAVASWQISGATSVSPSDEYCVMLGGVGSGSGNQSRWGGAFRVTGMNPGVHTITMKYKSISGGLAAFNDRELIVMPF